MLNLISKEMRQTRAQSQARKAGERAILTSAWEKQRTMKGAEKELERRIAL